MPVLRWLRIFVPLLLVAVLVAGTVLVFTSRSDLQSSRRRVDDSWSPLRTALDSRYLTLRTANDAVKNTPGPLKQIAAQVASDYKHWRDLEEHDSGNVAAAVEAANALEAGGRRLVRAARVAPRLQSDQAALSAVDAFAARPIPEPAGAFDDAVHEFEKLRARPSYTLAARILGYDAIPDFDTTGGVRRS
jgi:hypothetical protein